MYAGPSPRVMCNRQFCLAKRVKFYSAQLTCLPHMVTLNMVQRVPHGPQGKLWWLGGGCMRRMSGFMLSAVCWMSYSDELLNEGQKNLLNIAIGIEARNNDFPAYVPSTPRPQNQS